MAEIIIPRELDNSALGSWAGYVYQGLCGIYHCIRLIVEDRDKYVGSLLSRLEIIGPEKARI